ncbi:MAG: hypothetical protein RLZZ71_460 [Bacteroidota bacterium]
MLPREATRKSRMTAILPNHAVTGNDYGNWIFPYGLCGSANGFFISMLKGNPLVAFCFSELNLKKNVPDVLLKCCS